ncbi:hypothetical protein KY284_024136 [Solanum tuberosum]|nr:hypothetical protein KY284_024136 [Solanum tuberosum]
MDILSPSLANMDSLLEAHLKGNSLHGQSRKTREDSVATVLEEDPKMCTTNSGNLVISTQDLRRLTNNFASKNELDHDGFGVVYKGVTKDEIQIAVKRMESTIINFKALD